MVRASGTGEDLYCGKDHLVAFEFFPDPRLHLENKFLTVLSMTKPDRLCQELLSLHSLQPSFCLVFKGGRVNVILIKVHGNFFP